MRITSKPNTGKPGISHAVAMRNNITGGPASLCEALADAYELEHIIKVLQFQRRQIEKYGCCDHNRELNAMLNATAIPMAYVQRKPKRNARRCGAR